MEIKVIDRSLLDKMEDLRLDTFKIEKGFQSNIYIMNYDNHKLLMIGAFIDDELVGGLYFSPYFRTFGYVERLFVKEKYQNSKYHIGTSLLKYVENNITALNDYFKLYMDRIYIDYIDDNSKQVYLNAGYKYTRFDNTLVKRVRY